jgi:hypothetical protein
MEATGVSPLHLFFIFTGSTAPLGPGFCFLSFMAILQTVGLLRRAISSSQGLYLNTGQHKHRINTYTHQTFIPWMGFEPTIPAFKRAKTVQALDRSATVTGLHHFTPGKIAHDSHWIRGWVSRRDSLVTVEIQINSCLSWEPNPGSLVVQPLV